MAVSWKNTFLLVGFQFLLDMYVHPRDIDYFIAIAKSGRLASAASACGVSQPALSKAVKRLEDEAGVRLFERGIHGSKLTPAGQQFMASAVQFQLQHEEAARVMADLRAHQAGALRVGMTGVTRDSVAAHVLATLIKRRPGMRVVLQTGQSDALNEQVEQAKLDLAVVPAYPARPFSCEQEVIGHDMMVAAVRSSHPLVRKRLASLSDLVPFSWALGAAHTTARQSVFDVFARAGLPAPHVALEVAFVTEASLAMVAATDLVALVPSRALESTAGRGLVELPIDGLRVERHLVLLSRRHAHWSPLMMSFREELISRVGQK